MKKHFRKSRPAEETVEKTIVHRSGAGSSKPEQNKAFRRPKRGGCSGGGGGGGGPISVAGIRG